MSSLVNLDEELSPAHWKYDLNQKKATVQGEKFGSEGGESKPEEQHPAMVVLIKSCG